MYIHIYKFVQAAQIKPFEKQIITNNFYLLT